MAELGQEPYWYLYRYFKRTLEQIFFALLFEPFHDFADVLGTMAGAEQDGVVGFDEDHILNAEDGDEFVWRPDEISGGVESETGARGEILSGPREQLVDGVPRANIAPADIGRDDTDA